MGYSPQSWKELDKTEQLLLHFQHHLFYLFFYLFIFETWCDGVPNKGTTAIHEILAKKTHFKFNQDDAPGKFTWRDILQNNWPVLFQSVKIMKYKETLRKERIQIRSKQTWEMNTRPDPWLNPGSQTR